ncbi:MAG: hypothetical protein ABFC89_09090 [Methanospirillum sp.]
MAAVFTGAEEEPEEVAMVEYVEPDDDVDEQHPAAKRTNAKTARRARTRNLMIVDS